MKNIFDSIVGTIGNTPLIKINSISNDDVVFYAKMEAFNPGRSSKDRIALPIILKAEKEGLLKPGGTIIEGTSGNTGLALALVGINRGYKVILVMPDKMSPEKINLVKAIGCEVIVAPTEVEPDDPKSYYSVAKRLSEEIPNSFYTRQYWNPSNPEAHYATTGPELWEQSSGKITHFVAGVGTGGTISGVAKYLKEQNSNIKIIAPDPIGSILAHYHEHRNEDIAAHSYKIEGVGEDIIPSNIDFDLIDEFVKVNDQEAFDWTRKIALEDGIMSGGSSGMAIAGAMKCEYPAGSFVVILLPDTGERYLGKIFSDSWLRSNGFLDKAVSIEQILESKSPALQTIKTVQSDQTVGDALFQFRKFEAITQLIVEEDGKYYTLERKDVFNKLLSSNDKNQKLKDLISSNSNSVINIKESLEILKEKVLSQGLVLIEGRKDYLEILTLKDLVSNLIV